MTNGCGRNWDVERQFPLAVAAINRIVEGLNAEGSPALLPQRL